VRALTKPSVAVWAINQTARRDTGAVRDLLAAGAALRKAQERALQSGKSDDLRAAQAAEREAVLDLVKRARSVLADADRPASAATLEKIARTLGAAAVDEDLRPVLKAGRLTEELEPAGFGGLAGMAPDATSRTVAGSTAARGDELAERRRQKEERRARARDLQGRVRELEQRVREAEREAEAAEKAAGKAREAADAARAEADEAAAELAELENA
jgi:hypothetical protein